MDYFRSGYLGRGFSHRARDTLTSEKEKRESIRALSFSVENIHRTGRSRVNSPMHTIPSHVHRPTLSESHNYLPERLILVRSALASLSGVKDETRGGGLSPLCTPHMGIHPEDSEG